uniref:Uncharacterized protein n=1 Tax=Arundo donax TaxID=35708 RepID=A0A0A9DQI9_ARUDO
MVAMPPFLSSIVGVEYSSFRIDRSTKSPWIRGLHSESVTLGAAWGGSLPPCSVLVLGYAMEVSCPVHGEVFHLRTAINRSDLVGGSQPSVGVDPRPAYMAD